MSPFAPPPLAIAAIVGLLAGTHAAIWGMYKDALHEGFVPARFARSMIVGSLVAVLLQLVLRLELPGPAALVTLFGLAYASERGVIEVWKTFLREEDQAKYFIPMQFTIRGVPVARRGARVAAGAGYVAAVALCLGAIASLDRGGSTPLNPGRTALVGLLVGLIIAIGGAWKDAFAEGFEPLKFLRSPAMTVPFALVLAQFTDSYLLATVAAIGFERATVETYKKFCFPMKQPGKFAGKPVLFPDMVMRRRRFVPVYVAIWLAVLASGALALGDRTNRQHDARPQSAAFRGQP